MTDIQKENKSGGKVPNLRFPEFTEQWESKPLREVVKINQGLQIAISERSTENKTGSYFYITNEFLKAGSGKKYYILNPPQSVICTEKDILMTRTGNTGQVVTNVSGAFHNNFFKVAYPEYIDKIFLYNFLKLNKTQNQILRFAGTSTIPDLNHSDFYRIVISFPSNIEQEKISSFLSMIDERIQAQSKIIEGLEKLKVATAKKIFSQEFRFKDDKGNDFSEWEEILLGEVMSIPEKTKAQNIDKNKLLTVKLHLKGVLKNDNTDTLSFGATNYFIRKKGQFIYGKQNLFNGAFDIIPDEFDGFLSSGDVPTLEINNSKINSSFLLYLMGRKEFYKPLEDFATGSGSKRIHEKTLLGIKIPFPSLPEQTKIANFLSAIDSKIDMENQLLQKLEEQKKFLLQNMFV